MNPELTYTLPAYQTSCGIVDMMAHIMERYFSNTPDTGVGDRMCEGLLRAIIEEARKVVEKPDDYGARSNLMWSGTVAHNGICGVGRQEDWASHFIEHEISAIYGVAHGAGFARLGVENPDIDLLADKLHQHKGEVVGSYVKLTRSDSRRIYMLCEDSSHF